MSAPLHPRYRATSLRTPLAALALALVLLAAAHWSTELVPSAWKPGPSFGSASFYALYPNPADPEQTEAATVNVRIWGRGRHVNTGTRVDIWWEHSAVPRPVTDFQRWHDIPESLKGAARMAGTAVLLGSRAEADAWVQAQLAAALTRVQPDIASAALPASPRATTYFIQYLDRIWAEQLFSAKAVISYALWGSAAAALVWGFVRYEAITHAQSLARRGLCVRCSYPRAGLRSGDPCPECGAQPVADDGRWHSVL